MQTQEEKEIARNASYVRIACRAAQDASALAAAILESTNPGDLKKDHKDANAILDACGHLMASINALLIKGDDFDDLKRIGAAREKHARQWLGRMGVDWR